jgi:Zn-finger nucleic acid-binding protein
MPDLVCPKCESPMSSYERSGITLEQCTGCRGVFLDRGELERLVDAEGAYYAREPREPRREPQRYEHRSEGYGHKRPHRKREGFLGELLDF